MTKEKEQPWGSFGSVGGRMGSGTCSSLSPDRSDELAAKEAEDHDELLNLNFAYLDQGSDNEDEKPRRESFEQGSKLQDSTQDESSFSTDSDKDSPTRRHAFTPAFTAAAVFNPSSFSPFTPSSFVSHNVFCPSESPFTPNCDNSYFQSAEFDFPEAEILRHLENFCYD